MAGCQIQLGVHRDRGQPHPQPQFPRHRADPGQGSDAGRRGPGHRCRARRRDPGRPEDPPHPPAGIHHRQAGRDPRADRHVGGAPGVEGPHGDRRGQRGAEHHQVRRPLRSRSRRHHSRTARFERGGADRGREGISASASSTSAAAPPTSRCSRTARSGIPRSSPSPGTTSPTTSRWRCGPRPSMPKRSRSSMRAHIAKLVAPDETIEGAERGRFALRAGLRGRPSARSSSRVTKSCLPLIQAELRRSGYEDLIAAGHGCSRAAARRWKG